MSKDTDKLDVIKEKPFEGVPYPDWQPIEVIQEEPFKGVPYPNW